MKEGYIKSPQEISQQAEYFDVFLAVREDEEHEGVILGHSLYEEEAIIFIEKDRLDRAPTQIYHLFKPGISGKDRLGAVFGGDL